MFGLHTVVISPGATGSAPRYQPKMLLSELGRFSRCHSES